MIHNVKFKLDKFNYDKFKLDVVFAIAYDRLKRSNFMFLGRRKELSVLEDAYLSDQSAFIPVYGRRRVGKSELILAGRF